MVVGSFKKIFDSQRIEFIPQVQSVVDPGVTGSKHMGDPPLRLDRYPTLVVPEQAGHSVLRWSLGGISSNSTVVESF
jgi:hypothetical protein